MSAAPAVAQAAQEKRLDRYACSTCTYGISVLVPPTRCPICGDYAWKPEGRKPRAA
jgi:rubrerythrin